MSVSDDEPAVEVGGSVSIGDTAGVESGGSSNPMGAAFEGWLAFADVVSDTNLGVADLMVGGADVARAALEEQIPSLLQ